MKKPNWNEWKNTKHVKVWEACALSMDMDPNEITPQKKMVGTYDGVGREVENEGPLFEQRDFQTPELKKEFERRIRVLLTNLSNQICFPIDPHEQKPVEKKPNNYLVCLSDFASWAISTWDDLPLELKEMASSLPRLSGGMADPAGVEKPLETRQRRTWLIIIAALCKNSKIDYGNRGAAAQIAKMTQNMDTVVSEDTILDVLRQIPDALEARMK